MNYGAVKEADMGLQGGVWENVVVNNFCWGGDKLYVLQRDPCDTYYVKCYPLHVCWIC